MSSSNCLGCATGPLDNPADRDHGIQYMLAVPLVLGRLSARDYEDAASADLRIGALRAKMVCAEDPKYTRDYHDLDKRSIANAVALELTDGARLEEVVEYPIGHNRRHHGIPLLEAKFRTNLARRFAPRQQQRIFNVSLDQARVEAMSVHEYVDLYVG